MATKDDQMRIDLMGGRSSLAGSESATALEKGTIAVLPRPRLIDKVVKTFLLLASVDCPRRTIRLTDNNWPSSDAETKRRE